MPRDAVLKKACISAMSASASATSPRSASICWRAASSVRPLPIQQAVHLLGDGDARSARSRAGAGLRC
jgi:hypothetical protein